MTVAFQPRPVPETPSWPQSVVTVVGNPKPASRTARAGQSVAELLASHLGEPFGATEPIDLVELAPGLFGRPGEHEEVAHALDVVRSASVLVLATPVYKASYTGLLKSFLDLFAAQSLSGVVAVPVTISGSPAHRLLADIALRPVLAELGASVPTPPLALEERDLDDLQVAVASWVSVNARVVRATTLALQPVAEPAP